MAARIKLGDLVQVITGRDKGQVGRVLSVLHKEERVVVEGVNRITKHVKPSQRNPQGGRVQINASIHMSNVMPVDPSTGKGTRVRFEERSGVKHRVAVKSGTSLGEIKRPSKAS